MHLPGDTGCATRIDVSGSPFVGSGSPFVVSGSPFVGCQNGDCHSEKKKTKNLQIVDSEFKKSKKFWSRNFNVKSDQYSNRSSTLEFSAQRQPV